ncbi:MAG: RES family NAD+ phosphorylase [Chitinophagaceae bacterium]|nr:RES family NAD+ phosphorylase [Chitinophagaceae bacterium]
MTVFRITLDKYSHKLFASGNPARWNSKGVKIIYTAGTRALACLENIVHRNSRGFNGNFRTLLIDIPEKLKTEEIQRNDLRQNWQQYQSVNYTQEIGTKWIAGNSSAILRVPSAIIPEEFNYLINPAHIDFKHIRLVSTEPFE